METDDTSGLTVEYISVSPFPHGFGTLEDGSPFAFRLVKRTMQVEIYRSDLRSEVPDTDDVVARATSPVTEIDLTDERSVLGLVRDLLSAAEPTRNEATQNSDGTTVRALLGKISSVIDSI